MAGSAVGLIVFGDIILFVIIAVVAGYGLHLFWRRCQKDRVIVRDLTSNSQVVPAEAVLELPVQVIVMPSVPPIE